MIPKRKYFKKYTNEQIIDFIRTSYSASETVIKMGYDPSQRFLVKRFSDEYNVSIEHFSRINQRTHSLNEDFFSDLNATSIYWLGFVMADGNVRNFKHQHYLKVHLAIKDEQHLHNLKSDLNYGGSLRYYEARTMTAKGHSYQTQPSVNLQITSKKIVQDLVSLDCLPNKTKVGTKISDKIPEELLSHFIRGYFDGEGSIVIDKQLRKQKSVHQLSIFILGCEQILLQIRDIICNKLNVNEVKISKRQGVYCLKWAGNSQCTRIFDWLYKDAERFLERKHQKYIEHKNSYSDPIQLQRH